MQESAADPTFLWSNPDVDPWIGVIKAHLARGMRHSSLFYLTLGNTGPNEILRKTIQTRNQRTWFLKTLACFRLKHWLGRDRVVSVLCSAEPNDRSMSFWKRQEQPGLQLSLGCGPTLGFTNAFHSLNYCHRDIKKEEPCVGGREDFSQRTMCVCVVGVEKDNEARGAPSSSQKPAVYTSSTASSRI